MWCRSWLVVGLDIILSGSTFLLTGFWAVVQFKWVVVQQPAVAALAEHVLLAATPMLAAVRGAQLAIMASGVAGAPFYLAILLPLLYVAFFSPLESSFVKQVGVFRGEGNAALGVMGWSSASSGPSRR